MRRLLVLFVLFMVPAAAFAEDAPTRPPSKAEAVALARVWLDAQRAYERIPGMSAAIVHDQEVLWSGGSGYADPATKRAATADTIYSICSVSKLFTSIAAMQLRDRGKLALDQSVATYLPWFTMKASDVGGPVTIEGVMTHSAGLPAEADYPYWVGSFDFPTREQIVERVKTQSLLYPSESLYKYSNLGLILLGEAVAAQSGMPYDAYIRKNILEPLKLESTTTEIPLAENGKRLAVGYSAVRRDGTRASLPAFQTRGVAAAAGFASTANDLAKFAAWQFRAIANRDESVLSGRTLRAMQRIHWTDPDFKTFRGLGFSVLRIDDQTFVGHGGDCPGFRTQFMLQTAEKIGVAVMANASAVSVRDYAHALYTMVAPAVSTGDATPAASLAPFIGSYDEFPWNGETIFFSWGGELASVSMPTMTPMNAMERYRRTGANTFRRVRKDKTLGEEVVFDLDANGRAIRVTTDSNPLPRMEL
jgi:CubicO group peptidase (beta-lactamase class C family)